MGFTYKKIRKVEFVAKTQFLYQELETKIEPVAGKNQKPSRVAIKQCQTTFYLKNYQARSLTGKKKPDPSQGYNARKHIGRNL